MKKKMQKKKPWNLSPHPILREYVEEFMELNGRSSATSVVEEALREFFEKRGIKIGATPEELLKAILAARAEKSEGTHEGK